MLKAWQLQWATASKCIFRHHPHCLLSNSTSQCQRNAACYPLLPLLKEKPKHKKKITRNFRRNVHVLWTLQCIAIDPESKPSGISMYAEMRICNPMSKRCFWKVFLTKSPGWATWMLNIHFHAVNEHAHDVIHHDLCREGYAGFCMLYVSKRPQTTCQRESFVIHIIHFPCAPLPPAICRTHGASLYFALKPRRYIKFQFLISPPSALHNGREASVAT